jgi:hypothetical protein
LRKKTDVKREIPDIVYRLYFLPVNVENVTDILEREKRNPHRQQDIADVETFFARKGVSNPGKNVENTEIGLEKPVKNIGKEICVLEVKEYQQVNDYPDYKMQGFPFFLPRLVYKSSLIIVENRGEQQNQHKKSARFVIEKETDESQIHIPLQNPVFEQAETRKNHSKESPEVKLREQQRVFGVKNKYVFQ